MEDHHSARSITAPLHLATFEGKKKKESKSVNTDIPTQILHRF